MKNASLLSLGTGKLGDVVGYRTRNGVAVRKRVYNPRNPRSQAQAIQRCAFAALASNVRWFSGVLNNSFDGASNGNGDLNAFRKANSSYARAAVIAGVNNDFDSYPAIFQPRGSYALSVLPSLVVSRGRLTNPVNYSSSSVFLPLASAAVSTTEAWVSAVEAAGLNMGDQITMMVAYQPSGSDALESIRGGYGSIIIRPDVSITSSTSVITDGHLNPVLFEVNGIDAQTATGGMNLILAESYGHTILAVSTIRSTRVADGWEHSNDTFHPIGDFEGNNALVAVPSFQGGANPTYDGGSDYYTEQAQSENPTTVE